MAHPHPDNDAYPKRVIWMQEEDTDGTLKWVLIGLSDDGEVQDPSDYQDVRAPLPSQPAGRVWMRDEETGKWINEPVEASQEELAKADAAVRRAHSSAPQDDHYGDGEDDESPHWRPVANSNHGGQHHNQRGSRPSSSSSMPSIHQKYAMRLARKDNNVSTISEEEPQDVLNNEGGAGEDGVKYHMVKPSDTFQFICLKYKVSADALRAANNISGSTLKNAPKKLVIPPPTPKKKQKEEDDEEEKKKEKITEAKKVAPIKKKMEMPVKSSVSSTSTLRSSVASHSTLRSSAASHSTLRSSMASTSTFQSSVASASTLRSSVPTTSTIPRNPAPIIKPKVEEKEEVQYHWVEPDDSLRWICLKYKVNANDLRHANNFTGSNLLLAPKKLIIPKPKVSTKAKKSSRLRRKATDGSNASVSSRTSMRSGGGHNEQDSLNSSFHSLTMANVAMNNNDDDQDSVSNLLNLSFMSGHQSIQPAPKKGLPPRVMSSSTKTADNHTASLTVSGEYRTSITRSGDGGGEHYGELSSSLLSAFSAPIAPMTMVHLPEAQARKMSRSCDSSSEDESEEELFGRISSSNGGVRYHDVKPTDTIEYLCMKYRVSAPALRRANIGLTGRNLQTGPKRLIVPPRTSQPSNTNFSKKGTKDTHETHETWDIETVTTHDDETNTLALSDGHSTLADQMATLDDDDEVLYHDVLPSDTLPGVCLRYGISAYELRRANNFRGLNLNSAPERLVIPQKQGQKRNSGSSSSSTNKTSHKCSLKSMTEEEKIQSLMEHVPNSRQTKKPLLSHNEARAYLEYNDWNFDQALRNVKIDTEWSKEKSRTPFQQGRRPVKSNFGR